MKTFPFKMVYGTIDVMYEYGDDRVVRVKDMLYKGKTVQPPDELQVLMIDAIYDKERGEEKPN